MQCTNNLKQIGLGLHNYNDTYGKFPAGAYTAFGRLPTGKTGPLMPSFARGNMLTRILPFVEKQPLFDLIDNLSNGFGRNTDNLVDPQSGLQIRQIEVPDFNCPSDTFRLTPANPTVSTSLECASASYYASRGPSSIGQNAAHTCDIWLTVWKELKRNYQTIGTAPYDKKHTANRPGGPFNDRGYMYQCDIADVDDGMANTIFVGEVRIDCNSGIWKGWSHTGSEQGRITMLVPINHDSCHDATFTALPGMPYEDGCYRRDAGGPARGFHSRHPGGANFLFGDGSVHFLSETMDEYLYCYLGDMNAGANGFVSQIPN